MGALLLGSLFDGIGGFVLAGTRCGFTPVWASEIEPFPISVTKLHFPDMHHVGDITKLDGAKLPPVDLVCGGSPCQDMSTASGKRKGLKGERSGLFFEQIRVIREMRQRDMAAGRTAFDVRPRYMCWENVPGSFSSQRGRDFRIVLEEICGIADGSVSVPRPPGWKWLSAGAVMGDQFSVAWRVLDAQRWPRTPQRRKRIYLVADFGGRTAPKILFEQESLFGDTAEGEKTRQNAASRTQGGAGAAGGAEATLTAAFSAGAGASAGGIGYSGTCAPTLKGSPSGNCMPSILCVNDQGGNRIDLSRDVAGTLRSQDHGHAPILMDMTVGLYENHGIDARYTGPHKVAPTMSARYGTGGNNVPLITQKKFQGENEPPPAETYCIAGNIIDRKENNGGNGIGVQADVSYTLNTQDRHCIFSQQRSDEYMANTVVGTQAARQYKDATDLVCDKGNAGRLLIRRLLPIECERLQGYPDHWTDLPGTSDSIRYRALGNSVAIPCVEYVLRGIAYFLHKQTL